MAAVEDRLEGRVLDVGCGVGALAEQISPQRYLGVDADSESIGEARRSHPDHRFEIVVRDATWVEKLPGGGFDTIVLLAVLEHLSDPEELLGALARRLEPHGSIEVTTPAPALEWAHAMGARIGLFSADASEEHERLIDRPGMERIAEAAGLRVVEFERFLKGANQRFRLSAATE
jgi:2-polyprenyl-3-methyl-5-hydroxy-6-metoxy-1,4-benzoquinol methylase